MKNKGITFSLLAAICLGVAGCGAEEYKITASSSSSELGYVTGGGSYTMGSTVGLKIYSNLGCRVDYIRFTNSEGASTDYSDFVSVEGNYDYYDFDLKELKLFPSLSINSLYISRILLSHLEITL